MGGLLGSLLGAAARAIFRGGGMEAKVAASLPNRANCEPSGRYQRVQRTYDRIRVLRTGCSCYGCFSGG